MYDMTDEWDRYMLRWDGYSAATLAEFETNGRLTWWDSAQCYTLKCDDGTTLVIRESAEFRS